jgi:hypothetical protein
MISLCPRLYRAEPLGEQGRSNHLGKKCDPIPAPSRGKSADFPCSCGDHFGRSDVNARIQGTRLPPVNAARANVGRRGPERRRRASTCRLAARRRTLTVGATPNEPEKTPIGRPIESRKVRISLRQSHFGCKSMQIAANPGKLYSTTGSTPAHLTRHNSLHPFTFGKFSLRPPEPKVKFTVTQCNPVRK